MCFAPWWPRLPTADLDPGWAVALAVAYEQGLVFGRDVLFTFGPLGSWVTWQFWPSTYLPSLLLWAAIGGLSAALVWSAAPSGWRRWLGLLGVLLFSTMPDSALMVLPVAFVLHCWRMQGLSPLAWLAVPLLAILSLTKLTVLPIACLATVVGAFMTVQPARSVVLAGAVAVVAGSVAWTLLAGQPWAAFPSWLLGAAEVARAYPQAMASPSMDGHVGGLAAKAPFALGAGLALFWLCALARPRDAGEAMRRRLAWLFFLAAVGAVAFKVATVRADHLHLLPGYAILAGLCLLLVATDDPRSGPLASLAAIACMAVVGLAQPDVLRPDQGLLADRLQQTAGGWRELAAGRWPAAALERRSSAGRASLPAAPPWLNTAQATFDIVGYDQYLLAALNPRAWRPRPVFQGYSAYSKRLALANRDAIAAPDGPRYLLARVQTIDQRWPTQDDPAPWPLLRSGFRVAGRYANHLVLESTEHAQPAAPERQPMRGERSEPAGDGAWVALPDGIPELYVQVEPTVAWLDVLRGLLWKPVVFHLEVRWASGGVGRYRLVPEIAAGGFLLSPRLFTLDALQAWVEGGRVDGERPSAVRIVEAGGHPVRAQFTFSDRSPI